MASCMRDLLGIARPLQRCSRRRVSWLPDRPVAPAFPSSDGGLWGDGFPGHSGATAPVSHRLPRTIALMAGNLSKGRPLHVCRYDRVRKLRTSTTRLTLVRYVPSAATRRSAFPVDEPPDPRGLDEARALAPRVGRFDAAWSGPAVRARQT